MKIGINASFLNLKSGIGTYVFNLVKHLQLLENIDEFHFYLSRLSYSPEWFNEKRSKVHTFNIPQYNSLKKVLWEQLRLPSHVKKTAPDVFHSPAFISPITLKTHSVITIHDLAYLVFPETILNLKLRFYNYFINKSIENASRIITPSAFIKNEILEYFKCDEDKVVVVKEGVSENYFPVTNKDERKPYLDGQNINKPFFLFVGLIEPRKNLVKILEAFSGLKEKGMLFVIAGKKGWMYEKVFETINKHNLEKHVIITGEISTDELRILYSSCIAMVFTTLYEGFGLPILEAMSCGTPVITSNSSAMPEVAGNAAILVDPGDVEEIREAMDRILSDTELRKGLSEKGIQHSRQFSWKKCAEETNRVYHSI